ncbi:Oxalate decarboxylase OxdC [Lasiodiplodia hormozganensis]|uniref:Oxalate decarboxylase OxdC n=1 Tax=Lasiodiplodia hormozganensis TaxID=869390 RepID=A0AA40CQW0_9PEZI|nr:Oxalate decarboxylase OxdC [Lasiodiplodia hormozganensis]
MVQSLSLLLGLSALGAVHGAPAVDPLRGSTDLQGYNPSNILTDEDTTNVQYELAPGQTNDADLGTFLDFSDIENPQPIRGTKGGTDPGPRNPEVDRQNSDKLAPPGTDHGQTINAQWSMGLSHAKLGKEGAGWSRQQNLNVLPDATAMAGVDMRLEPGGYRELHWHVAGEWALMLNGTVRVQAVQEDGKSFVDDVSKGDVWFFPPGIPHSIQALDGGAEFMLVFDDGSFSEDNTFLASEIFAHNPKEVLAKNLHVDTSAFDDIPDGELFIFPGTPAPKDIEEQNVTGSAGVLSGPASYTYHFSEQEAYEVPGGSVKIVDPLTFPAAPNFSAALVTIKPGALREVHWHPSSDEWSFFLAGTARATLFTPPDVATTFDYHAGDVGYFPKSNSHYIENVGDDNVILLEVLQADHFSDMSLSQWLALTPHQIVIDTLNLSNETLDAIPKEKEIVVSGDSS